MSILPGSYQPIIDHHILIVRDWFDGVGLQDFGVDLEQAFSRSWLSSGVFACPLFSLFYGLWMVTRSGLGLGFDSLGPFPAQEVNCRLGRMDGCFGQTDQSACCL
jgi:hypothetical protein